MNDHELVKNMSSFSREVGKKVIKIISLDLINERKIPIEYHALFILNMFEDLVLSYSAFSGEGVEKTIDVFCARLKQGAQKEKELN